jgi:hypothetical protein
MTDLIYFFAGPVAIGVIVLLYWMSEREWKILTTEEIFTLWDANVDKFGNVEEFARALERAIQEKNT